MGQWYNPPEAGTGTVTSFSFTDANGFTGIVATPTTTPNLTLSLPITSNVIPKGTGTGLSNGTWAFSGNDIYPVTDGSNIGLTGTNRVGTIFLASTLNYAASLIFSEGATERARFLTGGNFGVGLTAPTAIAHFKGAGATSATFSLKIDNSSNAAIIYGRNDRRVAIATTTFATSALSISGTVAGTSIDIVGGTTGIKMNDSNITSGFDIDLSSTTAIGLDVNVTGDTARAFLFTTFTGTNRIISTGSLTGTISTNFLEIIRGNGTGGLEDMSGSAVFINDTDPDVGAITGDVLTVQKNDVTFFRLSTDSRIVYTDGNQGASKVLTSDANGVATWATNNGPAISLNRIPRGTGTSITDGNWVNSGNDIIPQVDGANIGQTLVGGIGNLFLNGNLVYRGSSNLVILEAAVERARMIAGGNLGIGVTPTTTRLHVKGSGATSATFGFQVHNSTGTNNAFIIRDDGFSSFGTTPVTTYTVNIDGVTSGAINASTTLVGGIAINVVSNTAGAWGVQAQANGSASSAAIRGTTTIGSAGEFIASSTAGFGVKANSAIGSAIYANQDGTLAASTSAIGVRIERTGTLGAFDFTGALLSVNSTVADTGHLVHVIKQTVDTFIISSTKNIGIGTATFGASMVGGFAMKTGTNPSGNVTDVFQMYSADIVAGNAAPHFRTEASDIIKLFKGAAVADAAGGVVIDVEARAAINALLARMRVTGGNGLIAD